MRIKGKAGKRRDAGKVWISGAQDFRISGRIDGILDFRNSGSREELMDLWISGAQDFRISGRIEGILDFRNSESREIA